MTDPLWRHIPDAVACLIVLGVHFAFSRWLSPRMAKVAVWVACAWSIASFILSLPAIANSYDGPAWYFWLRGAGIAWGIFCTGVFILWFVWRRIPKPKVSPERRRFLMAAKTAVVAAPMAVTGYGIYVARNSLAVREVKIAFPGLPKDLDGLRIAQLTDIHCSPFLSRAAVARAVAMANETRPHIAVVTGDMVSRVHDPLEDCIRELGRLRADAGIHGCLGNHEIYASAEDYAEELGIDNHIRFLRGSAEKLRFGNATLNLVGVDYQRMRMPYLVGAERLVDPAAFNLLLSHNPDVFPVAASKGFHLTLSGHTHGGQIAVEILEQQVAIARFFTPFIYGVYRRPGSAIYVSRGVGTVGVPARIGAPPEVSLIQLCAT